MSTIQIVISVSALLFLSSMAVAFAMNDLLNQKIKRGLSLVFAVSAVCCLCELLALVVEVYYPDMILIHKVFKLIELSLVPFIPYFFSIALLNSKTIKTVFLVILLMHAGFQIISCFWLELVFTVNSKNVYDHGELYIIYPIVCVLSGCVPIIGLMDFAGRSQYRAKYLMALPMVFLIYLVSIQLIDIDFKMDYVNLSTLLAISTIIYINIYLSTDSLTKLLNRQSYETIIRNIRKDCTIIAFDLNDFKPINDTYGHSKGDEVLRIFATCIKKVYSKNGLCYRIGGDEFCVILTKDTESVTRLSKELRDMMDEMRKTNPILPTFSAGYAKYSLYSSMSVQDAIEFADRRMYKYKELKRKLKK